MNNRDLYDMFGANRKTDNIKIRQIIKYTPNGQEFHITIWKYSKVGGDYFCQKIGEDFALMNNPNEIPTAFDNLFTITN